jgi:hypothetical protein
MTNTMSDFGQREGWTIVIDTDCDGPTIAWADEDEQTKTNT